MDVFGCVLLGPHYKNFWLPRVKSYDYSPLKQFIHISHNLKANTTSGRQALESGDLAA